MSAGSIQDQQGNGRADVDINEGTTPVYSQVPHLQPGGCIDEGTTSTSSREVPLDLSSSDDTEITETGDDDADDGGEAEDGE
jgi:hypothetical protein